MHRFRVLLALLFAASAARADCPGSLNPTDVAAFVNARTVEALDRAFTPARRHHAGLSLLYHTRRLALNPGATEERRYLGVLPRSEAELRQVADLELTRDPFCDDPRLSDVVHGMFGRAARIARHLGIGHRGVLQLCLWSDGELAETAWDDCRWLVKNDWPKSYKAILTFPPGDQYRLCGVRTLGELSPGVARQKCSAW